MRRLVGIIAGVILLLPPGLAAPQNDNTTNSLLQTLGVKGIPQPAPAADERPVEGAGNDDTDALLNCYQQFSGPQPDPAKISPPHLTRSPAFGYILRADFPKTGDAKTVDRLTCWRGGFTTQKDLPIPPLYPPGATKADPATEQAVTDWQKRREAEALKIATAKRFPPPDEQTIAQLEGIWLIDTKPDKGPCISHWYLKPQIQFEFRKSGGRALLFEPYDAWTPVALSGVEKSGDMLELQGVVRTGGFASFMRLRAVAPGKIEILPPEGKTGPAQTAYRCGEPDRSVTDTMSPDSLGLLSQGLVATIPGVADADICAGKVRNPPWKLIQTEVYGPVHYWILGMGFQPLHRFSFDFIRSIRQIDAHTIKLEMQEHLEKGDGWDVAESRGATYELTVIDTGARLVIPELSTSFVKCTANQPGSGGMHRW